MCRFPCQRSRRLEQVSAPLPEGVSDEVSSGLGPLLPRAVQEATS
ncbi:hypothetical protein [Sorangium sp. So ce1335]